MLPLPCGRILILARRMGVNQCTPERVRAVSDEKISACPAQLPEAANSSGWMGVGTVDITLDELAPVVRFERGRSRGGRKTRRASAANRGRTRETRRALVSPPHPRSRCCVRCCDTRRTWSKTRPSRTRALLRKSRRRSPPLCVCTIDRRRRAGRGSALDYAGALAGSCAAQGAPESH